MSAFAWLVVGVLLAMTAPLSVAALWWAQQRYQQNWNSKPIIEIRVDDKKKVHIKNAGLIGIEGVSLTIATYELTYGYPKTLKGAALSTVSRWSGPVLDHGTVKAGADKVIDLRATPYNADFFEVVVPPGHVGGLDIPDDAMRKIYCLRITFRHELSKEKFVVYVLTGATVGFMDQWDEFKRPAIGGPLKGEAEIVRLRKEIRAHESMIYDDPEASVYRNGRI